MKAAYFQKVYVQNIPMSVMEDAGNEFSDGGLAALAFEECDQESYLTGFLTNRQRKVVRFLADGYTRKETAISLKVSLQAIHQIIPRIRRRLRQKAKLKI